jgi:D-arabinose 1-dehydrogenase-like Zn-dependent alcohol dehydrogenase
MSITRIHAYAVTHRGGQAEPFSYDRTLGANDVLVRITHCSLARGDVQFIDNDWGDTRFPLVPGHEIVGLIEAAGSTVTDLAVGDRVGIGYQQEACFSCEFCNDGSEQLCLAQKVIGVDRYGGLADRIAVDARFAFKLPPTLDSAASTPLLSAGLTVYTAIVRAGLRHRSNVAVMGIGGLGQLAIQFLRHTEHTVSAFSHSPSKRALIERLGATYIDSSHAASVTNARGTFDLILSTLNTRFDLNAYLSMLRPQGKLCFVAQPLEDLSINVGRLYDSAQRTIYGNYVGSRRDMIAMLAFAAEHDVESLVEIVPFSKINQAIDMVRSGNVPVRVVLQTEQ